MTNLQYQTTLRGKLEFQGAGLHTGAPSRAVVFPAPARSGLQFVLEDGVRFPATAEYVVETSRATVVGTGGRTVSTVEHLLAALFGMGIDNAEIHVSGPEIPVMDGSAKLFADAIASVGALSLGEPRTRFIPASATFFRDGERSLVVLPAASFRIKFMADYAEPIGAQYFDSEITPTVFEEEVAASRTFGYLHEVEVLRRRGLALGGTLENAVVFAPDGPLQPLRWPNEVVRHKVLDMIGDLALLGAWPQCEIIGIKSGHKLHCIATQELRRGLLTTLPSARVR
ncbi:MAG: UDP-3-O-acyl-N-acetylglucosamine deacetylase [Candidatus Eremiobacteraeota bacterium]|nr:UDP-3-O-acyl-N-acetylglucosamine deacetylase [Candidatus Eremiobacteraeota bacterium]